MNTPRHSQNVMESALEIAYFAGVAQFRTENSRDMFELFQEWAIEFEKTPYQSDNWMELIEIYATEMLMIEIERGQAKTHGSIELPSIKKPKSLDDWKELPSDTWVYLPKHGERILKKSHFTELCQGSDSWAYHLYILCDWQAPETLLDEFGGLDSMMIDVTR